MLLVDNLVERFKENLDSSKCIDLAVAWATTGKALTALEKAVTERGITVRAIVGTRGNLTDPEALERLDEIGALRLVPDDCRMFHPKVYIFRGERNSVAWIGSANFTRGGFETNEETVFATENSESVVGWFKKRWDDCGELPSDAIADYRRSWTPNRPSLSFKERIGIIDDELLEHLRQARDWNGYVTALRRADDWWRRHDKSWWSVLDERRHSWLHTIRTIGPIATREDWSDLRPKEVQMLLGVYKDDDLEAGLLGNMDSAWIAKKVFRESSPDNRRIRKTIKESVDKVAMARPNEFPDVAIEAFRNIEKENGFAIGVATRILTLARPDRIVSVNRAVKKRLRDVFPDLDALDGAKDYKRLLSKLYRQPWYNVEEPSDDTERTWWSMRAALIDCFVYSP